MSNIITISVLKDFKDRNGTVYNLSNWTDDEIQAAIDEAEELVERITETRFYAATETWYLSGQGSRFLRLTPKINYPLLSVDSLLEVDESDSTIDTWEEDTDFVNNGHYLLAVDIDDSARIGTIISNGYFPEGVKNFKLTGSFGSCTLANCPEAIKRVIKLLALESISPGMSYLTRREVVQQSWPDHSVTYRSGQRNVQNSATGFEELDRILARYKNYASLFLHDEMTQYQ